MKTKQLFELALAAGLLVGIQFVDAAPSVLARDRNEPGVNYYTGIPIGDFTNGINAANSALSKITNTTLTVSHGAPLTLTPSYRTISLLDSTTNAVSLVICTNVTVSAGTFVTNVAIVVP